MGIESWKKGFVIHDDKTKLVCPFEGKNFSMEGRIVTFFVMTNGRRGPIKNAIKAKEIAFFYYFYEFLWSYQIYP